KIGFLSFEMVLNRKIGFLSFEMFLDRKMGFTFTFSHLADAFIQSDLQGCIYTFYIYTDGTLHIRSNLGFSVLLKDASTGNRTSNLAITKRLLYLLYHCQRPHGSSAHSLLGRFSK